MNEELEHEIRAFLVQHRAEQFRLLGDLVGMPSENPPGDCAKHALAVADRLKKMGLAAEKHPVPQHLCRERGMEGIVNLVIRHEYGPGPVVALQAHLDTAPAGPGWATDPFEATVKNGVMYGRGVAESKASAVAYLSAMMALRSLALPLAGTLEVHLTYDRETGGYLGVPWLLQQGIVNPDYAICAGGSYGIVTTHNGILYLEVKVRGRRGHPALPETGPDVADAANRVISALYALRRRYAKTKPKVRGVAGPTISIESINGGRQPSGGAEEIVINVARGIMPDEDPAEIEKQISADIGNTVMAMNGIVCRIRRAGLVEPLAPIAGTEKLIRMLSKTGNRIMGERVISEGQAYYTDARHYVAVGIPAVCYGAGPKSIAESMAYRANENIALDDLRKATEVIAVALGEFMSPAT